MRPYVDAIRDLSASRREVLWTVLEYDEDAPLTPDEVTERLPADRDLTQDNVKYHLTGLTETHLLKATKRRQPDQRGKDPLAYSISPTGHDALVKALEIRLEQLTGTDWLSESELQERWSYVEHQREINGDRVLDGAFCTRCGRVYAGDGICPDCEIDIEGDLVADGGWSR